MHCMLNTEGWNPELPLEAIGFDRDHVRQAVPMVRKPHSLGTFVLVTLLCAVFWTGLGGWVLQAGCCERGTPTSSRVTSPL